MQGLKPPSFLQMKKKLHAAGEVEGQMNSFESLLDVLLHGLLLRDGQRKFYSSAAWPKAAGQMHSPMAYEMVIPWLPAS